MEPDLAITREAVEILTHQQFDAIKRQLLNGTKLRVFIDFSLPNGYVYFIRSRQGNLHTSDNPIHGGISPEGDVST